MEAEGGGNFRVVVPLIARFTVMPPHKHWTSKYRSVRYAVHDNLCLAFEGPTPARLNRLVRFVHRVRYVQPFYG